MIVRRSIASRVRYVHVIRSFELARLYDNNRPSRLQFPPKDVLDL